MSDAIMLFSFVMNVFLLIAVLALAGDRRSLSDQVRWLQQQIEQLERERGTVYESGGASRLLLLLVLAAGAIALFAYLAQGR